jgi:glycosyltransferase involved in cell wall biosynthesis
LKVSIITVCLNSEKTIKRALQSVRQQAYDNLEVIVIDGISTDGTLLIVEDFKDLVSIIVSEKDKGIYDAMNKGIALASGEIIYFLNSDDELVGSNIIADVVGLFQTKAALQMVYGDIVVRFPSHDQYTKHKQVGQHNVLHTGICHQAVFARKSFFGEIGKFNLDFRIYADFDWIIRAFLTRGVIQYIPRLVSIFHAGGASMSNPRHNLQERLAVQIQYSQGWALKLGHYKMRARYHIYRKLGFYN